MSTQAQNCLKLFKGQDPAKIIKALSMLKSSVVIELMDHCQAYSEEDLAIKLSLSCYK